MSRVHSFDSDEAAARLEAQYVTSDMVAARQAILRALALRAGERVLDIGCGPGLLAAEMAAAVGGGGAVEGLDVSPTMVALAGRRCAAQPWAAFREGDAGRLPCADEAFDVAVAAQVYEFVPDVPGALAELWRVLRPGGRAAVLDTDWGTIAWSAADSARRDRMLAAWRARYADAHLPLRLAPLLRAAGFHVAGREALPMFNPEYSENAYSAHLLRTIAANAPGHDGISEAEAQAWLADVMHLAERGAYFFSMTRFLFVVVKAG